MAKEKMTLKTYEWESTKGRLKKKPVAKNYDMPHTEENNGTSNVKSYGMPITVNAYQEMVKKFKDEAAPDLSVFSKLLQVTFSKSSIMRVLSQEGCEYVSIMQAMTEEELEDGSKKKKVTFVLQGLNAFRTPVKEDLLLKTNEEDGSERIHRDDDPIIEERGNGEEEPEPFKSLTGDKIKSQSLSDFMKDLFTAIAKR
ncbi:hypothetical protein ESA94_05085 [Lacibacter luteus]|uniref:Uncharacterized protein n=1 Tax=Lacibacter luteus TaxID=2508719 RepID=A0A4Q1CNQ9_9BACT|nr:hypothetical protein [Lacibacter luteus]RXK62385.1 hypothetical protein ESA94_05085 [Lacibacter luteus]